MEPIEERLSQKLKELFGSVLIPSLTAAVSKHGERGGTVAQPHQVLLQFYLDVSNIDFRVTGIRGSCHCCGSELACMDDRFSASSSATAAFSLALSFPPSFRCVKPANDGGFALAASLLRGQSMA